MLICRGECDEKKTPAFVLALRWQNLLLLAMVGGAVLFGFEKSAQASGFTDAANMGTARQSHTATLLDDGSVLITGGYNGSSILASAEYYNPETGTFTPITAPMNSARRDHTATRLADGRVLITGGLTPGSVVSNTAELYDPSTKSFTPTTGSMNNGAGLPASLGRVAHTATLLSSGKVLITGGRRGTTSSTSLNTAELYDPANGSFTRTVDLIAYRAYHTATLLSDGRVFIAGGFINSSTQPINATNTAEIFAADGLSSTATPTNMATARGYHAAVLLRDDTVLITGGSSYSSIFNTNSASLRKAEIFNPASGGSFSSLGDMVYPHSSHTATLLASGRVLIAGSMDRATTSGTTSGDTELYKPEIVDPNNRFAPELAMVTTRANYPAVPFTNGTVLLAGGATPDQNASTAAAVIYNPENIAVAPLAYTFSDRIVGSTSPTQSFTITNAAGYAVTLESIEISGIDSTMFAWTSTCGTTLPVLILAGRNCSVDVTFTPGSVGTKSASLDIYYTDLQLAVWPVALKGTGTAPPPPTSNLTVTFAGSGAGSVHSSSDPTQAQQISCQGGSGTSCQQQFPYGTNVTLTPTADSNSLFAWSGACTGTGDCVLNSLSADTAVTATFNYVQPARINSTYYNSLQEAYAGAFAGVGNVIEAREFTFTGPLVLDKNIGVTLKGGYNLNYDFNGQIGFTTIQGTLDVSQGTVDISKINFIGISNPENIAVTPAAYTFSDRAVGSTSPSQSFTITNDAGYAVNIDSIQITGTESAMFALTNNCPTTLPVDGNCSVDVTFTPASGGSKSASLDITYDNGVQLQLWPVALNGTGIAPPPPTTSALTVSFAGSGVGSVSSSSTPPPVLPLQEIACSGGAGTPCQGQFLTGSTVILSAAGGSNSQFAGWTGACTGTGTCQVTMDAAKSVSATFNTIPVLPTISGTPATSVTVGNSYSFTPTATNTTSFSIANQPPFWAAFNPATGTLSGTPTNADVGTYSGIVITAHNANGSASLPAFDITVQPIPAVMVPGTPAAYFNTIQAAYVTVGSGSSITSQAVTFAENLQFNRAVSIKFEGGKNNLFQDSGGFTTIQGTLDISQGTADLSKINIQ